MRARKSTPFKGVSAINYRPVWAGLYRAAIIDNIPDPVEAVGVLSVTPTADFAALGWSTGPMEGCTDTTEYPITLTNIGSDSLDWTVSFDANPCFSIVDAIGDPISGGTLGAGDSVAVKILYAYAGIGNISISFLFTNTTNGLGSASVIANAVNGGSPAVDSLDFVSTAIYATLIGWDEFTDVSVPPRKYLTKICSGQVMASYHTPTDCTGPITGWTGLKFTGSSTYDTGTGLPVDGVTQYTPNGGTYASPVWGNATTTLDMNFPAIGGTCVDKTTAATNRFALGNGSCDTCFSFPAPQTVAADASTLDETLTDEDTEATAWARAVPVIDALPTASTSLVRGAGEFTFGLTTVEYSIPLSGLVVNGSYILRVSYEVTPIAGGDTVVETEDIPFVADAETKIITGSFSADEGYNKTMYDAYCVCPFGGGGGGPPGPM